MKMEMTAAAIATLVSALTSAFVTLWLTRINKKKNLDDQLDGVLKIAVQYPYLESENFTNSWKSDFDHSDDKYLRYDMYCTLLFNYLSRMAKHYKYNKKNMEKDLAIKDWIRLHQKYWQYPTSSYENVDSYDKEFVELVNSYLK
jgi:hypothetical protein